MISNPISDRVTFEVLRRAFETLGDEMSIVLARSAYSPIVRNAHDTGTALMDVDCNVISQGRTTPLHMASLTYAARAVKQKFEERLNPGDVYLLNDPYEGGSHLPDLFLVAPLYYEGGFIGYLGSEAHHTDTGGIVPGGNSPLSTEIFQEGLRIPPSPLFLEGRPNETLFNLIERNVRVPDTVIGDLQAQIAALKVGAEVFAKLARRFGIETVRSFIAEIFDYTERLTRAQIADWPDGSYEFTDWIDDDGIRNEPIPIKVTITVDGEHLVFDYSGTGSQVPSAINSGEAVTASVAMAALRLVLKGDIPHNAGFMRVLDVVIPLGSILNARYPAAMAARSLTLQRTFDATMGCLAAIVPDLGMAATEGGNPLITFFGQDERNREFIFVDMHFGAWGARHDRDGVSGICAPYVSVMNTPIEVIERETPLLLTEYEFVPNSCGPGQFRGGFGIARSYKLDRGNPVSVVVRSDRMKFLPYGLYGGESGRGGKNLLRRGGSEEELGSKARFVLNVGDVYTSVHPGGGGWGDPFTRDPVLVYNDVHNERVTESFAREEFGVVMNREGADLDATKSLRAEHGS